MTLLLFLLALAWTSPALAQTPPRVDAGAQARADRISAMPDGDPVSRINQLLAAKDLDDGALFALATTHPGLVEQLVTDKYRVGVDYLGTLPAPELYRIRAGETIIRTRKVLHSNEWDAAVALAESLQFPKFNEKKLDAVRCGPLEARVFRVEVTIAQNKKKSDADSVELAWPSTPDRDERSRDTLSRYFGARPSRTSQGVGALLPVKDGSFEDPESLSRYWSLVDGLMLGTNTPAGEVIVDNKFAVDGTQSLRFNNTDKTRLFPEAVQRVPVQPGTHVRARAQLKTDNLRVQYLQHEDHVYLSMVYLDANGAPVSEVAKATGRLSTHAWELLEVQQQAPPAAAFVQVGVISAVSGTAWFDAVILEVVQ